MPLKSIVIHIVNACECSYQMKSLYYFPFDSVNCPVKTIVKFSLLSEGKLLSSKMQRN